MNTKTPQTPDIPFFSGRFKKKYLAVAVPVMLIILLLSAGCVNTLPEQNNTSLINLSEKEKIAPFNISGTGSYHGDSLYLANTITVLAVASGTEPFILSLQSENGKQTLLFNEPGSSNGKRPRYYITSREISLGNYTLNIISGTDWQIFLSSGTKAHYSINESYEGYITGSGSQNLSLPPTSGELTVLRGYGSTPGYISAELLVNGSVIQRMETDATGMIGLQAAYSPKNTADTISLNVVSDSEWVFEVTQPTPVRPMLFENIAGRGNYVSAFSVFNDKQHQKLVFSNAGNTSIDAVLYTADGAADVSIPAKTNGYHYRIYQDQRQIIPITALIAIKAEPDCEWLVEWCDYVVYFSQISPDISQKAVPRIQDEDLLEFPVLQRFADTRFTAVSVPASESEILKLAATNYSTIEFAGNYYSLSIAGW